MKDSITELQLLQIRLQAMARDDEECRVLVPALLATLETAYARLVSQGWTEHEALGSLMDLLSQRFEEIAKRVHPD